MASILGACSYLANSVVGAVSSSKEDQYCHPYAVLIAFANMSLSPLGSKLGLSDHHFWVTPPGPCAAAERTKRQHSRDDLSYVSFYIRLAIDALRQEKNLKESSEVDEKQKAVLKIIGFCKATTALLEKSYANEQDNTLTAIQSISDTLGSYDFTGATQLTPLASSKNWQKNTFALWNKPEVKNIWSIRDFVIASVQIESKELNAVNHTLSERGVAYLKLVHAAGYISKIPSVTLTVTYATPQPAAAAAQQ